MIKTADEAANIAKAYVMMGWPDLKEQYGVTSVAFQDGCFVVRGSWGSSGLVDVKVDGEGNVIGWSSNPTREPT